MSLLAHLIAADIRRTRWMALGWTAVVVAGGAITLTRPFVTGQMAASTAFSIAVSLMSVAWALSVIAIVPIVVQAHPAVGDNAFWMTRPFPARTLLLSKVALVALLLLGIPLTVDVIVMSSFGVPPDRMALIELQHTLFRMLLLALLLAGAALTSNLARFAMLGGAALLTGALFVGALTAIALSRMAELQGESEFVAVGVSGDVSTHLADATDNTAFIVAVGLLIAAFAAVAAVQYSIRSRWRSIPVGAAGVLAAWLISSWWPWPLIPVRKEVPEWARQPSALQLRALEARGGFDQDLSLRPARLHDLRAQVLLTDVAPDWVGRAELIRASLTLPDGTELASRGHSYPASLPADAGTEAPLNRALKRLLGVERLIGSSTGLFHQGETAVVFRMREEDFARHRSATGRYRGEFAVDLQRIAIAGVLPLTSGATLHDGAYRVVVGGVEPLARGMQMRSRVWSASSVFDRRPQPAYSLFLRNPQRREAAVGSTGPVWFGGGLAFLFGIGAVSPGSSPGFDARGEQTIFPGSVGYPEDRMGLTPDWFSDVELVVVRTLSEGTVARTLNIPRLQITPESRTTRE